MTCRARVAMLVCALQTTVATSLPPGMGGPFLFSTLTLLALYILLMMVRVRLEAQRARLDGLYLARED